MPSVTTSFSATIDPQANPDQTFVRLKTPADNTPNAPTATLDAEYSATWFTSDIIAANATMNTGLWGYVTRVITPSVTGTYTLQVDSATGLALDPPTYPQPDTQISLYADAFDPQHPLTNVLALNEDIDYIDDSGNIVNLLSRISDITLEAGKTYVLVVTSYSSGASGTANFSVTGPGSVSVQDPASNTAPTLASVSAADLGQAAAGSATYSFDVTYDDSDGTIDANSIGAANVSVTKGGASLTVTGATWNAATGTATYTVQAPGGSWNDADVGTYTIAVNGNSVKDNLGAAVAANPAAGSFQVSMDTTPPDAAISIDKGTLALGDTAQVTITFTEAVTGFSNANLTVANGSLTSVVSTDGGITWKATLTPAAGVTDTTNVISLDKAGIADLAGNAGSGTRQTLNYTVDTVRPTATISMLDHALAIGETTTVTVTFSEAVTGFTNADLAVANGSLSSLSSSDGGVTWTATFTPDTGITDTTNVITLDNTGVADLAGNAGAGTTSSANYTVDSVRPTATIVVADNALSAGETSLVTITFSEAVTGLAAGDLSVANGSLSAPESADGGITWTATLTPAANVSDTTNVITLDNTRVADLAGNAGTGTTNSNNYAVQTVAPTATIVLSDSALKIGDTSNVTITFSEPVTGLANTHLAAPNGTLSEIASADGGLTWTATFTPSANVTDSTNVITLDTSGVVNAAGNAGAGVATSANYTIDTARPTATITLDDDALAIGETATVTIRFSEAVTGLTGADFTVANGSLANLSSADGGRTWTATLTPTGGITDTSNVITLDNTGVADLAGNAGTGTTDSANYTIDSARPTATIVVAESTLLAGESSLVTITFSEAVTGFTAADLSVASGSVSTPASSDGGITWTATFTPATDVSDTSNVITLDNTGVADLAGNAGTGTTASNNYAVQTVRPTATISLSDTALKAGESSTVTITFSEAVTGLTTGDLSTPNGSVGPLTSADGGVTWTGTFVPASSTTASGQVISLAMSGVANAAGNAGTGVAASPSYDIDTVRPTVAIALGTTALAAGGHTNVTFTFNEAVTGFGIDDIDAGNAAISDLATADGGRTWTATLTANQGVGYVTGKVTVHGAALADQAGNTGAGDASSASFTIGTPPPSGGGGAAAARQPPSTACPPRPPHALTAQRAW